MFAFYAQIKFVHVAVVLASGLLFFLRGAGVLARQPLAMAAPVRYASVAIDTVLLTAALMLLTILPRAVFANGWLAVKLGLLPVYVVLGMFALRRAATPRGRALCFAGALLVYGCMLGIARTHQPLGPLAALLR